MTSLPVLRLCWPRACRVRWLTACLLALLLSLLAGPALAARHALLVGVSELPDEPQANWLRAPHNDVLLMQRALRQRGWSPQAMHTLADGLPGAELPELAHIRAALQRLQSTVNAGDFVLLYFSGHGTRFVDSAKTYQEPDGLAEMFLARDGALDDTEIGGWIQVLLAKGAFVWAVFDTCSAASMTRGGATSERSDTSGDADPVRFRGLTLAQLSAAMQRAAQHRTAGQPQPAAAEAPSVPAARYVAFFAAESHQRTPELRLPRDQTDADSHGLLTWALAEALASDAGSWRELFGQVLARYPAVIDELQQRFPGRELPSPVAEGALDVPLFENSALAASTQPSWPARQRQGRLALEAGQLDGLVSGQTVRLIAQVPGQSVREQTAVLDDVGLGRTSVALPAPWAKLPEATSWQVAAFTTPAPFMLGVHASDAVARQLLPGISLSYPVGLQRVDAAQAQVRVAAADTGFSLAAAGQSARHYPSVRDAQRALTDLAVQRWLQHLLQLAAQPQAEPLDGLEMSLWTPSAPDQASQRQALRAAARPPLPGAEIEVRNASGRSVDLLLVGMAADGSLWPLFPSALGESNRFERGDARTPAHKRFALPEPVRAAGGGVLAFATPARPHSVARFQGLSPTVAVEDDALPDILLRGGATSRGQPVHAVQVRW